MSNVTNSRRKFLQLGLATGGVSAFAALTGCVRQPNARKPQQSSQSRGSSATNSGTVAADSVGEKAAEPLARGIDLEKWKQNRGTAYEADWERNMWWEDESEGDPTKWQPNTGNGWNQNKLMPIAPDPISGQQAFHDTVVAIRKVG